MNIYTHLADQSVKDKLESKSNHNGHIFLNF